MDAVKVEFHQARADSNSEGEGTTAEEVKQAQAANVAADLRRLRYLRFPSLAADLRKVSSQRNGWVWVDDLRKAAEDCRTPRRFAHFGCVGRCASFWSAAVLCRFGCPQTFHSALGMHLVRASLGRVLLKSLKVRQRGREFIGVFRLFQSSDLAPPRRRWKANSMRRLQPRTSATILFGRKAYADTPHWAASLQSVLKVLP